MYVCMHVCEVLLAVYVGRGSVVKAVFKTLKYRQVHAVATSGEY